MHSIMAEAFLENPEGHHTGSMVWAALVNKGNPLSSPSGIEPASRFRRFALQSGAWARVVIPLIVLALCILLPLIFAGA